MPAVLESRYSKISLRDYQKNTGEEGNFPLILFLDVDCERHYNPYNRYLAIIRGSPDLITQLVALLSLWVEVYSTPFVFLTDGRVSVRELNLCQILRLGVARSIVAVFDVVEKEIAHLRM